MAGELELLWQVRRTLNEVLDQNDPAYIQGNWADVNQRISAWWRAYKNWEAVDTFSEAFEDSRMTVRTFPADFKNQKSKTFKGGTIDVTSDRFFADSRYTRPSVAEQGQHKTGYEVPAEKQKYLAQRGIDSSPFADPANFATRETKYEAGLHDLSASLLNPNLSIFDQIHNNEQGAHFSFLPLSKEEDQEVLYNLTRFAKDKVTIPHLYPIVRDYRAEMTRLKLAYELDLGVGFTAVPAPRPGTGPQYKLRYGLGNKTTIVGSSVPRTVTRNIYDARRAAARRFKGILGKRDAKNEIVIAIRKHAGPFPVYAIRMGEVLKCYEIKKGAMEFDHNEINKDGRLVHTYMVERGTAGLPVREPVRILAYNVPRNVQNVPNVPVLPARPPNPMAGQGPAPPPPPLRGGVKAPPPSTDITFDKTFRIRLETALSELGETPKRSGMRVFVIAPKYDEVFRAILADVENQVNDLNIKKGYRLSLASLSNRGEISKVEVRLYQY